MSLMPQRFSPSWRSIGNANESVPFQPFKSLQTFQSSKPEDHLRTIGTIGTCGTEAVRSRLNENIAAYLNPVARTKFAVYEGSGRKCGTNILRLAVSDQLQIKPHAALVVLK